LRHRSTFFLQKAKTMHFEEECKMLRLTRFSSWAQLTTSAVLVENRKPYIREDKCTSKKNAEKQD